MRDRADVSGSTPIQNAARILGVIFLIVGIGGFIPGLTTDYDQISNFDGVGGKELGLFGVNILENIVHLLYGVAGLALARTASSARAYFIWGGAIYLVIWIYGLLIDKDSTANFLGLNAASDWLHLALGIAMLAIGFLLGGRAAIGRRGATAA